VSDVNLMNVTDPQVPFARVKDTLRLYEPAAGHPVERKGAPQRTQ